MTVSENLIRNIIGGGSIAVPGEIAGTWEPWRNSWYLGATPKVW